MNFCVKVITVIGVGCVLVIGYFLANYRMFDDRDFPQIQTRHWIEEDVPSLLTDYFDRTGEYPIWQGDLDKLIFSSKYRLLEDPSEGAGRDGWGNNIEYSYPTSTKGVYRLRSLGEDGVPSADDIVFEGGYAKRKTGN